MAIPEKKPYERLSDYLERSLPAELEAGKSRGKATADIISKFNEEPPREMFAPFIWGATNASGSAGGGGGDADADAFIAAAGITDATQQTALQTLVTTLKSDNVWDKCNAIYPFVGGTATAHKFNLKDPQDTDAAYRLDFNGTWTHDANGAKANGTTSDFADTYWDVTSDASVNEHHNFKYATIPANTSCGYDGQGSPYLIIGTCQQLEGPTSVTSRNRKSKPIQCIWIDDCLSSGGSSVEGLEILKRDYNIDVTAMVFLIDRYEDRMKMTESRLISNFKVLKNIFVCSVYDMSQISKVIERNKKKRENEI